MPYMYDVYSMPSMLQWHLICIPLWSMCMDTHICLMKAYRLKHCRGHIVFHTMIYFDLTIGYFGVALLTSRQECINLQLHGISFEEILCNRKQHACWPVRIHCIENNAAMHTLAMNESDSNKPFLALSTSLVSKHDCISLQFILCPFLIRCFVQIYSK